MPQLSINFKGRLTSCFECCNLQFGLLDLKEKKKKVVVCVKKHVISLV